MEKITPINSIPTNISIAICIIYPTISIGIEAVIMYPDIILSPTLYGVSGIFSGLSEHSVGVCGVIGYLLNNVPMLVYKTVLKAENLNNGAAVGTGLANGVDMEDNVVTLGENALYLAVSLGRIGLEEVYELAESFGIILYQRIMLLVAGSDILLRRLVILFVDYKIVKIRDYLFVAFQYCIHS